jgi:hypothetical protein
LTGENIVDVVVSPAMAPEKLDCLFVGKPQEKVLMNIATSFPSVRNQGMSIRRRANNTTKGDADWLNKTPIRAPFNDTC